MRTFRNSHRLAALVGIGALALGLATGCGGNDDSAGHDSGASPSHSASAPAATGSPSAGAQFNTQDINFGQQMILHHKQAVEMSEAAESKASRADVKALAAKIKAAQGPEIAQMRQWLTEWGAPQPSAPAGGHDGGHQMPGMMTAAEMAKLAKATGAAYDRLFLQMMIRHHEGALEMAADEAKDGQNPGATALAKKIQADQTAEIAVMKKMLGTS